MRGISRENSYINDSVGYGYVCIPEGVDRSKYIKTCYRKEKVSILLDQGGSMIMDCYITKEALQNITFPVNSSSLGACVVFVSQKFNSKPIIIGCLSKTNESQLLDENTFKRGASNSNGSISIKGDPENGINIFVKNKNGGKFCLNVLGSTNSDIDVKCEGSITINSNNNLKIKSTSQIESIFIKDGIESVKLTIDSNGLTYRDENNSFIINKEEGKIIHNEGSEALLLGDTTQTEIEKLKTYVDTMKTALDTALGLINSTISGVSAPFTATMSAVTSGDFSKIKSTKSFID